MHINHLPLATIYPSAFADLSELIYSFIIRKTVIQKILTGTSTQELKF